MDASFVNISGSSFFTVLFFSPQLISIISISSSSGSRTLKQLAIAVEWAKVTLNCEKPNSLGFRAVYYDC